MYTVQRNFAASLSASGLSPKRQFEAVKKQTYKPVVVEKFHGRTVEHIEYPIGQGEILSATKTTKDDQVSYSVCTQPTASC